MLHRRRTTSGVGGRAPLPVLCVLGVLLAVGPIGLAMSDDSGHAGPQPDLSLADVARRAGCELSEFDTDPHSNPPVSGRVDERVSARDGSYVGRPAPSVLAVTHALLHGRVAVQYRPDLPQVEIDLLDRLARRKPTGALLFENQTGMREPVAATAYLTLMTCSRVDARTLSALRAFRARRGDFGQGF
jgi:hypothetical protein